MVVLIDLLRLDWPLDVPVSVAGVAVGVHASAFDWAAALLSGNVEDSWSVTWNLGTEPESGEVDSPTAGLTGVNNADVASAKL